LTYNYSPSSDGRFHFKRESSQFLKVAFIVGGSLILLFGLIVPAESLGIFGKGALILFGLAFGGAGFYLPQIHQEFTPGIISFDPENKRVVFAMDDQYHTTSIPFEQIDGFEIAFEKRSPSAANSTGIHYLHQHINLKRLNGGTWTITSTTNKQEAGEMLDFLTRNFKSLSQNVEAQRFNPPPKILVEKTQPLEIRWQAGRYGLGISDEKLTYSEFKSGGGIEKTKDFPLVGFSHVVYTYSAFIQNRNFSVTVHFSQGDQHKLTLFLRDLNPVECLQFENWLHQEISARKKLIA
jgi:hypothetical protein